MEYTENVPSLCQVTEDGMLRENYQPLIEKKLCE